MSDSPSDHAFPCLGERYDIEAFLGEGAVGRVYRGRDRQLRRRVAIKILRSHDVDARNRFCREARAQARLDHEHICRVYEIADADCGPFIVMQFIEGETLGRLAPKLDLSQKITLLEQVGRAVEAAHAGGVVHCDLKPSNIMVERRPDGELHAHVLDFGIARSCDAPDDDVEVATSGAPAYTAPEQILGALVGPLADVYSLGATAYSVLAEQTPFHGVTRADVKRKVLTEEPLRLGLVVPGTPEDLETIVSVAMSSDPRRRYPSAGAVADDLARWSRGESIRAGVSSPLMRAGTWLWSRRREVVVLALLVVSTALAVGTSLWLRQQGERRRELIDAYQIEVEQIDRLLRRARMMPLHDTTAAEESARQRLQAVETSLLEFGPLAKGPAYYALGFGHLMLRDFDDAEAWLRAAIDSGFADPEVESALGIALAMRILGGDHRRSLEQPDVEDAMRFLTASGPETAGRDLFHRALGLFLEGEVDDALETARKSSEATPWLYEARQLEGDILMARCRSAMSVGDTGAAFAEIRAAGVAYSEGLAVARSDPWLRAAEARRLMVLVELEQTVEQTDPVTLRRMVEAVEAAATALPSIADALLIDCRRTLEPLLEVDHEGSDLTDIEARVEAFISESRGAGGG